MARKGELIVRQRKAYSLSRFGQRHAIALNAEPKGDRLFPVTACVFPRKGLGWGGVQNGADGPPMTAYLEQEGGYILAAHVDGLGSLSALVCQIWLRAAYRPISGESDRRVWVHNGAGRSASYSSTEMRR
jgi:hypothetical protein